MLTNIISIGNSKGIRIPKILIEESGLKGKVKLKAKKGEIRIIEVPLDIPFSENTLLSEKALNVDWNRPEEDKAWKDL